MANSIHRRRVTRKPTPTSTVIPMASGGTRSDGRDPASSTAQPSLPLILPPNASYQFVTGDESLHAEALRAAATSAPLLIMGEPGTGKSGLARFIHERSGRRTGKFVELSCDSGSDHPLAARVFGDPQSRPGDGGAIAEAAGGTLLVSGLEHGARALGPQLLSCLDQRATVATFSQAGTRLIFEADQDIRNHVDRTLWQRLTAWPPILLTPLRVQRRKKWSLFRAFVEKLALEAGWETPVTVDFLQYVFVVGYGWPGNVTQLRDYASHLLQTGALQDRDLRLDPTFSFFDRSEAFAQDDAQVAAAAASGEYLVYRNRMQRDLARAVAALQAFESGRAWQQLSKASPGRTGAWSYPRIHWSDPHFASAEMCARVGQSYDAALARLGQWQDRLSAAELLYRPQELPWTSNPDVVRVVAGKNSTELADLVAYGLATGEIPDKDAFLTQVYEALVRLAPDLTPQDLQELGIPKARLKGLLARR